MAAILTFWSTTASDDVMADPVALLSITITHSGARFWPQKEKPQPQLFFSLAFVLVGSVASLKIPKSAISQAKTRQSTFFQ